MATGKREATLNTEPVVDPGVTDPEERKAIKERQAEMRQAVAWAYDHAPPSMDGGKVCPWCGWESAYNAGDDDARAIKDHFEKQHKTVMIEAFHHPDLGFDAYKIKQDMENKFLAEREMQAEDLRLLDELNTFDYLHVPKDLKQEVEGKGGALRWARPDNVQRYKDMGMRVVEKRKGDKMPHQHNHEDTTLRTNEMILMEIPPALKVQRDRAKALKARLGGADRQGSDRETVRSDIGKEAYEHFKTSGMDHTNAMRMANRVERGQARPEVEMLTRREPGEVSYQHSR